MTHKTRTFLNMSSAIALLGAATLWAPQASANAITYAVSLFGVQATGGASVAIAGSITTDGTLGLISDPAHIIDWDLIGAVLAPPGSRGIGSTLFDLVGPLSGTQNSTVALANSITATSLTLELPNSPQGFSLEFTNTSGPLHDISFFTIGPGSYFGQVIDLGVSPVANGIVNFSSPVFADGKSVAAVPGPLAGAGVPGLILAAAGLFGWRRRKKNGAAALAAA